MVEDNTGSLPKPSWHERETAQALQRLANARANLAQLTEQVEASGVAAVRDPADVARATQLQHEIERLITKASGRFGAGTARTKLAECQAQQRLVLERLGVESVAALDDLSAGPDATPVVDPTVLEFARRECAEAEKTFLEVAAMVIPEAEPEPEETDAEVIAAEGFGDGDLDLRIEPSAAS